LQDESQVEADRIEDELIEVKEEPGNEMWDDLDAEDWDDPAMASEYGLFVGRCHPITICLSSKICRL
jgi:hypothetical protein